MQGGAGSTLQEGAYSTLQGVADLTWQREVCSNLQGEKDSFLKSKILCGIIGVLKDNRQDKRTGANCAPRRSEDPKNKKEAAV